MTFRQRVMGLPLSPGSVIVEPGDVTVLRFENPRAKNALTPHMMVQFADAVDALDCAAVILYGAGDFCSGGDLEAVAQHLLTPGVGAELSAFMAGACDRLSAHSALVIGAVEGVALGGGAELLTACDWVVASPSAKIGFVHAAMGVSPGFGGGRRLVARLGTQGAIDWLLRGRSTPVAEAGALVQRMADVPLDHAMARAREVAGLPEAARRQVKALVRGERDEAEVFAELWGGPAHQSAITRFRQR